MATTFLRLHGSVQSDNGGVWTFPRSLDLTAFWGGALYGRALQVTVDGEGKMAFVGLSEQDVRVLMRFLAAWLDATVTAEQLCALPGAFND